MILSAQEISALAASSPPVETFGPQSDNLHLGVMLEGADTSLAGWLSTLPCPVIGIGAGGPGDGCDVIIEDESELGSLVENINASPLAAMVLVQHLRASESLQACHALNAESFAYATVQQGPEFAEWLAKANMPSAIEVSDPPLRSIRDGQTLHIRLADPANRNAIGTVMRDHLCEALELALLDNGIATVELTGEGRTFSSGGEVAEFGSVSDPATAHWIRSLRLPARRLAMLSDRLRVHVNGAAIGAGAEISAFGSLVTANADAWFQLPELKYGLIPGAGGTVSIPRRIGRQRTALLALSMKRLNAQAALEWGLVDEIVS